MHVLEQGALDSVCGSVGESTQGRADSAMPVPLLCIAACFLPPLASECSLAGEGVRKRRRRNGHLKSLAAEGAGNRLFGWRAALGRDAVHSWRSLDGG